jgi:hypothetical protein
MVNLFLTAAALLFSGSAFGQQAPGGKDKPKSSSPPPASSPAKPDKAAVPTLEEMLTGALKDNPDVRVAEAKVREADAELNRTRLLVTQKVIAFHRSLEAQKALVDVTEKQFKRYQELGGKNAISKELLDEQQQKLAAAKAKLAEVEAEMPYLLGKQPQAQAGNQFFGPFDLGTGQLYNLNTLIPYTGMGQSIFLSPNRPTPYNTLDLSNQIFSSFPTNQWFAPHDPFRVSPQPSKPAPPGSMAEKIRKALDTPITIKFVQQPITDVFAQIEKAAPGVSFRVVELKDRPIASLPVSNFQVQELPAGAVLQALEDTFPGLTFVVRDYGILVTWNEKLPPGALRVDTFWKAGKEKLAAGEGEAAKKNPPLEDVKGTILEVDANSGLVSISLGEDAGLQVGNTLEVYRLSPRPKYLGTLRLVEVKAKQAVAKPLPPLTGKMLQKGDHIASRVNGH